MCGRPTSVGCKRPAMCWIPSSAGSNIKSTAFGLLLPEVV
jgi:hypothetical protein